MRIEDVLNVAPHCQIHETAVRLAFRQLGRRRALAGWRRAFAAVRVSRPHATRRSDYVGHKSAVKATLQRQ